MTEWVTQAEAVRLLADVGDPISQQALSQYLKGHPEVARQDSGPGRAQKIDWAALKASRVTRQARGPSNSGPLFAEPVAAEPERPVRVVSERSPEAIDLGARRARADTDRAESDARRSRILADEAEGRVLDRSEAVNAVIAAGIALVRALEEGRHLAVEEIRAGVDTREGLAAMMRHERKVRSAFANALTDLAGSATPQLAAAE